MMEENDKGAKRDFLQEYRKAAFVGLVLTLFHISIWIPLHELAHALPCAMLGYNLAESSFISKAQTICGGMEKSTNPLHLYFFGWGPYILSLIVISIYWLRNTDKWYFRLPLHSAFFNIIENLIFQPILTARGITPDASYTLHALGQNAYVPHYFATIILAVLLYAPNAVKTKNDTAMILILGLFSVIMTFNSV